jgi:hypothetical protein
MSDKAKTVVSELAGCAYMLLILGMIVTFILTATGTISKPGPYYYGHCDHCGRSFKCSSWDLSHHEYERCESCGYGQIWWPPIDSTAWTQEKHRWGD